MIRFQSGLTPALMAIIAFLASSVVFGQSAPTRNYTSLEAERGTPLRLGYHASASTKTCSAVEPPTVRVIDPPDAGALSVQAGQLSTDRIRGCARMTIPARVLFYTAGRSGVGSDHVVYEVTTADGQIVVYDITITIKDKPAPPARMPRLEQKT